ncbi:MAG TPA: SCO family protein [Caulobacteraceae bacterium]|jgi:protein SCO1/2
MKPISRRVALCLIAAAALGAGCQKAEAPPAIGGPFTLIDQDGRTVSEQVLKGKWSAVFFGYTYCPDVCPMTMQTLGEARKRLGAKADKLQVVFITVDPERDTPDALKAYLKSEGFPPNTIGLTGSPPQIAGAAKAYKAFYAKAGEGKDYLMQHPAVVYLMDPQVRFKTALTYSLGPEETARQLSKAMS